MIAPVEIVHQHDVRPRQAQSHAGLFERTHGSVIAVIEYGLEPERGREHAGWRISARRYHVTADLRHQHRAPVRLCAEKLSEPQFAESVAVKRGGVVQRDTAGRRGRERCLRFIVVHGAEQIADFGGADTQFAHGETAAQCGLAQRRRFCGVCHDARGAASRADRSRLAWSAWAIRKL